MLWGCHRALELPGSDNDQAFEQGALEYAKDPEHIRLKWLLDFFSGKGVNSWEEFDYTWLIEEWLPCSNCMLICWPEMKDRQENYRLLRTSGKVTKNDTYMRVSTL